MKAFSGVLVLLLCAQQASAQQGREVPVTIKELDVEAAIQEFQSFQQELEVYRQEVSAGQTLAVETAEILADLRAGAEPENDYNEGPILEAIEAYIDGVVGKQVALVDFLESQRYRISYYANQMVASVRPRKLIELFGSEQQNVAAVESSVRNLDAAQGAIADFIDGVPPDQFDRETFRALSTMPLEQRQKLHQLVLRYQFARNARELARSRLKLVLGAQRRAGARKFDAPDVHPDLLLGQMFGSLDRIRLQMSVDLFFLEDYLVQFSQSSRTQEILQAFQQLAEMQGGLESPNPGLVSVLDWLSTSSTRRLSLSIAGLNERGITASGSSDLLREAYQGARPTGGTFLEGPR